MTQEDWKQILLDSLDKKDVWQGYSYWLRDEIHDPQMAEAVERFINYGAIPQYCTCGMAIKGKIAPHWIWWGDSPPISKHSLPKEVFYHRQNYDYKGRTSIHYVAFLIDR